jgi:hypothetical protein
MSARIQTPEWDGIVRRSAEFEIKAIDEEARSVEVTASTETVDSYGDIVEQTWDLKRYRKNPVVLWFHNAFGMFDGSRAEDYIPIGRAEGVRIVDGQLVCRIVFASSAVTQLAEQVFQGFREKVIRAVSVGFRPGKVTKETDEDGKTVYRLSKNELWEISCVPIPANPDAVAKAAALQRSGLARLAGHSPKTRKSTMDPEQLLEEANKAIERQKAELTAVTTRATDAETRAKTAEDALATEQTLSKKLETDLTKANEQVATLTGKVTELESGVAKATLDSLQGVKFAPAEREELDGLVKDLGIERVKSLLSKRADLGVTQPASAGGKEIKTGAPVETPSEDAGADLVKTVNERTTKVA